MARSIGRRKVGSWQTLAYVPMETNYEYVSPAG